MSTSKFAALAALVFLVATATAHQCIHDRLTLDSPAVFSEQALPERAKRAGDGTYDRIRIGFDISNLSLNDRYTCTREGQSFTVGTGARGTCSDGNDQNCLVQCAKEDVLTSAGISYIINKLLKPAITILEDRLNILRPAGGVTLKSATCGSFGGVSVTNNYKTPKSANMVGNWDVYDLVIFVTGRPVFGNTIAWALSCEYDASSGRPIGGHINIGMRNIKVDNSLLDNYNIRVVVHELSHVLGFSGGVPAYNNIIKQLSDPGKGTTVPFITSPKVLAQVRAQYNCPTMQGAPIEDFGGSGTAGSHWEKRIFRNEYMTGSAEQNSVISAVSLALFEDLGYYKPDYTKAETLAFGNGAGCTVATQLCSQWTGEFAICKDDPSAARPPRCTADGIAQAYCNTASFTSSLQSYYQYFSSPSVGGSDQLADFCPYYVGYSNGDCRDTTQNPNIQRTNVMDATGAYFSDSSRCFISTVIKSGYSKSGASANCYPMTCDNTNKKIVVTIGSGSSSAFTADCTAAGTITVNKNGYSGTVTCPSYAAFCGGSAAPVKPSTGTTGGSSTGDKGTPAQNSTIPVTPPVTPCPLDIAATCRAAVRSCGSMLDSCRKATIQCGVNGACANSAQVCTSGICTTPAPTCPSWCTSTNFATCSSTTGVCTCYSGYVQSGSTCIQSAPPTPMPATTIDSYEALAGSQTAFTVKCVDTACSANSLQMFGPTTSLMVLRWKNSATLLSATVETTVSMDVTPLSTATVWGIAGRVVDANSYYFLRYEKAGTAGLYFGIARAGSVTKRLVKSFTWPAGETHTLMMIFSGSTIYLQYDDQDLNGFPNLRYTTGGVALLGSGNVVYTEGSISTATTATFSLVGCISDTVFKQRVASILGVDVSAVTIKRGLGESGRCARDGTSVVTVSIAGTDQMPATHIASALQYHVETASELAANFAGADAASIAGVDTVASFEAASPTTQALIEGSTAGGNIVAAQSSPAGEGVGTGTGGGSGGSAVSAGAAAGIAVGCAVGCAAVAAAVGYKVAEKRTASGGGLGSRTDSQELDLYQRPENGIEPAKRKPKQGVDVYDYDTKNKHKSLTARGVYDD
eukprot:Opistho-2@94764